MHALDRRHAALCWILCPLPFLRAMADSADRETVWSTAFRSSFGQGQETQASSRDGSGPRCSPVAAELDDALPRVLGEHHQLADEGRARFLLPVPQLRQVAMREPEELLQLLLASVLRDLLDRGLHRRRE